MSNNFNPENFDEIKTFIIDRAVQMESKSKDTLVVRFDAKLTAEHFSRVWSNNSAVYIVRNMSKKDGVHEYTVAFFLSRSGKIIIASCDCVARLRCKHIVKAWDVHVKAEQNGFIPEIKTKEDDSNYE